MKVDFHLHTSNYSTCAVSTAMEQIKAAYDFGLDAIFITDHMLLFPQNQINDFNILFKPMKIYQGIEVTLRDSSNFEDIIVLGIHDPQIEGQNWTYKALYHFVKENGGVMILAHPYRYGNQVHPDILMYPPDAVEVLSSNVGTHKYDMRCALAKSLNVPMLKNSDSHHTSTLGCHFNELPDSCDTESKILDWITHSALR